MSETGKIEVKVKRVQTEGVRESKGSWCVQIEDGGRQKYCGRFDSYEEAMIVFGAEKDKHKMKEEECLVPKVVNPIVTSLEDDIREALRNMSCQVEHSLSRPVPPQRYARPIAGDVARLCRFGVNCMRTDIFHWVEADHPDEHPRMGTPALPLPVFKLDTMIDCHHWRQKACCALGDCCRFRHDPSKRGCEAVVNHRVRNNVGGWRNRGRKNCNRGAVLSRFLIDTFGFDKLRSGSGGMCSNVRFIIITL